jgi:hypothetical protein
MVYSKTSFKQAENLILETTRIQMMCISIWNDDTEVILQTIRQTSIIKSLYHLPTKRVGVSSISILLKR